MSEPIRVPLSDAQRAILQGYQAAINAAMVRRNEALAMVIAGVVDPSAVAAHAFEVVGSDLILTPPS